MREKNSYLRRSFGLIVLICITPTALAGFVSVSNSGFESPVTAPYIDILPTVTFSPSTPQGWSTTSGTTIAVARYNIEGQVFYGHGVDRNSLGVVNYQGNLISLTTHVANLRGGSLYQDTTTIQANTSYELTAQIFDRIDEPGETDSSFSFYAGGLGNIIQTTQIADVTDGWGEYQSFYLDANNLTDYVGQRLGIAFTHNSSAALTVDRVRLTSEFTQVPAPTSALLLLVPMILLGLKRARFRSAPK